jgi:hypothetical protein
MTITNKQLYHKRFAIIFIILVIPISLLIFIVNTNPVFATNGQTKLVYIPLILRQSGVTDIAVSDIITPANDVVLGEMIDISVLLENVGNQEVELDIPVYLTDTTDMLPIDSKTISGLGIGGSTTLTFTWDTGQILRSSNPILDGGFESGGVNDHILTAVHHLQDDKPDNNARDAMLPITVWQENSNLGLNLILMDSELTHISPHNGNRAVWLGGVDSENASITQTVTIPENNPTLVYWYWIQSSAAVFPCDTIYEGASGVKINNTTIGQDHRLCGDLDTGWLENSIALNDYAGQTVSLEIWLQIPENFLYGGPSFYIDDVSIESQ